MAGKKARTNSKRKIKYGAHPAITLENKARRVVRNINKSADPQGPQKKLLII